MSYVLDSLLSIGCLEVFGYSAPILPLPGNKTHDKVDLTIVTHGGQVLRRKASHMFKAIKSRKQSVNYNQFRRFTLFAIRLKEHEITSSRQAVTKFISTLATHISAQNGTSGQIGYSDNSS